MSPPLDSEFEVVGGVPVYWTPGVAGSRPFAGLVFRVGQMDETLVTAGTTHLVEHLALPARATPGLDVNGVVDTTSTVLWFSGDVADVVRELARATQSLRALPRWRFEHERSILLTEAANRSSAFVPHSLALRYGARGPGLSGQPEYGLNAVDLATAQRWADARFSRFQCALVLTFAPPPEIAEILAVLHDGERTPAPEPEHIPYLEFPSVFPGGVVGYVGASYVVPRTYASTVGQRLLEGRLRDTLRYRGGLTYAVSTSYEPLGPDLACASVLVDTMESNSEAVRNGLVATFEGLARTGPNAAELEAVKSEFKRDPMDNSELIGLLMYRAHSHLIGHEVKSRSEDLEALESLTAGDVADALRQTSDSMLLVQPANVALPGGGFRPYPIDSPRQIEDGRRFKRAGLPFRRTGAERELVVSPSGVTLHGEGFVRSIPADDTAAVIRYRGGIRELWSGDGFVVVVDPGIWRNGGDLPALIDRLGAGVTVDLTTDPPIFDDATLQAAVKAFDSNDMQRAYDLFSEGTRHHPEDVVAWAYRSAAAKALSRHRESLEGASRACALEPDFAWAQQLRSEGLWWSGRVDEALDAVRAALALGVSDVDALSDFAYYLAEAGEDDEAETVVQLLEALHPQHQYTWFAKGWAAQARGAFDSALPALEHVVELTPENPYAHNNVGWVLLQRGDTESALQAFDRALALAEDNPYAPYNRVVALGQLGRQAEAEQALDSLERRRLARTETALESDPADRDALNTRTEALITLGSLEAARDSARDHVERYPDDFAALLVLVELESRLGDDERARVTLGQAEALSPFDRHVLALAVELDSRGSVSPERRSALAAALDSSPNDERLLRARATLTLAEDDRTAARSAIERMLERSPLSCCAIALSGLLAASEGDLAEARRAHTSSRIVTPTCFFAHRLETAIAER